jgi:hypothetical protein
MWWPMEDYKNLTRDRIRAQLPTRKASGAVKIFWSRDYSLYDRSPAGTEPPGNGRSKTGCAFISEGCGRAAVGLSLRAAN